MERWSVGVRLTPHATKARCPEYTETYLSVEPHDNCLRQPYAFVWLMDITTGLTSNLQPPLTKSYGLMVGVLDPTYNNSFI